MDLKGIKEVGTHGSDGIKQQIRNQDGAPAAAWTRGGERPERWTAVQIRGWRGTRGGPWEKEEVVEGGRSTGSRAAINLKMMGESLRREPLGSPPISEARKRVCADSVDGGAGVCGCTWFSIPTRSARPCQIGHAAVSWHFRKLLLLLLYPIVLSLREENNGGETDR
jgi:hypothetical protein